MEENQRFLSNVSNLLSKKGVRFKKLSDNVFSQFPCSRSKSDGFVFYKSDFPCIDQLFISDGALHQQIFLIAFSGRSVCTEFEYQRLLLKAAEANAMESRVVWKIERENSYILPVLEMTLFPLPAESVDPDLIWNAVESLNILFKDEVIEFQDRVKKQVEALLREKSCHFFYPWPTNTGFKYSTGFKRRYITDDRVRTNPLEITVEDRIIYTLSFFILDRSPSKAFIHLSQVLTEEVNRHMPIGYLTFNPGTREVEISFEIDYKALPEEDFLHCLTFQLEETFDLIFETYYWVVQEFLQLYELDTYSPTSIRKPGMSRYLISTLYPRTTYESLSSQDQADCPICLELFTPDSCVRTLPCRHIYHEDCIDSWIASNAKCCMCRGKQLCYVRYQSKVRPLNV